MNKNDIVYFTQDTRKKPDIYIVKEVLEDNRVRLERKDGSNFQYWDTKHLTILHKYPENCITSIELESLVKGYLNLKDFEIEEHIFPHQRDDQDYWGGYRGFWIKNNAFKVQIQFDNTFYVECLLPSYSHINYFWQNLNPTVKDVEFILKRSSLKILETIAVRKKEIEILSKND